jgi:hypothetical protein
MRLRVLGATLLALGAITLVPALARAETGLIGYFDVPFTGSPNIGGVGVNHNGTGGTAPGDVFVSGVSQEMEQYSALGQLKSTFPPGDVFSFTGDFAVDQVTGNLVFAEEVLSPDGTRLLSHGFDVVRTGPDDSNVDEQQRLTVVATGGTFKLSCCFENGASLNTKPLNYNATAAEVETAINEMIAVTDPASSATVTGGPGGPTGATPYTITYDGGPIAGDDAEQLYVDGSKLSGPFRTITIATPVPGGAVEICTPPADECKRPAQGNGVGGQIDGAEAVALAPAGAPNAGDLLVAEHWPERISEFSPGGSFIRAFGWDVNAHGPNDSSANEEQKVTIDATGGKFSLALPVSEYGEGPAPTTGAAGHGDLTEGSTTVANVSTSTGEFAIGEVITGPNIPTGTTVIGVGSGTLTLSAAPTKNVPGAELSGSDLDYNASANQVEAALDALPSIGGQGGSVTVSGANGGPYTVTFGGALGGDDISSMSASGAGLTGGEETATASTVADGGAFEVCVQAAGDVCKGGFSGTALGHFPGHIGGIAEDSSGAIYVVDAGGGNLSTEWVQKLTPAGAGFVPSLFGSDEVQKLTVNAGAGQFRLAFGAEEGATSGKANIVEGSKVLTNVVTNSGQFRVGQPISDVSGNRYFIHSGTIITAVTANTVTMSSPAVQSITNYGIRSDTPYFTPDLPYNASAAAVESAIDALPSVGAAGGSVSVSEGPGDVGGTTPYVIAFSGGKLHDADVPPVEAENGATPLSGGAGAGADQAMVVTETDGGPRGLDERTTPLDVAVDPSDNVLVAKGFALNATKCADGSPSPNEVRIAVFNTAGVLQETSAPCLYVGTRFSEPNLVVDPVSGVPYLGADVSGLQAETNPVFGEGIRVLVFGDTGSAPSLTLDPPSNLGSTGVTISGTINPHGPLAAAGHPHPTNTTYRVEFREEGESEWTIYAPDTSVGTGSAPVPFTTGVSGLTPKVTYEIRTVVSKIGFPTQFGAPQTITTVGAPPTIDAFTSSRVAASSADLEALINPLGTETSYHFEYGKTPAYGQSTPETSIGEGRHGVSVIDHIVGLEPVVYHFRVVATNEYGTTTSSDQTFSFYPGGCPNSIVRAQTGSGSLPDCRAYELVSPSDSGAASLTIGGPNSPYAAPSRLSFFGYFGSIPGPWNPQNLFGDLYVATRTAEGWSTHYVGVPADQRPQVGGPPNGGIHSNGSSRPDPILSSRSMDHFLDWEQGQQGVPTAESPQFGSMAPYLWGADGTSQGRLPTNLSQIPGGEVDLKEGGFNGDLMPSPDFSHYFFSSANVVFAPGGQTSGDGSVYDNDLETGSVEVVSKLPNGDPIPQEPGDETDDYFTLPAASVDGSHILIAATGTGVCGEADCLTSYASIPCYANPVPVKCPENLPSHLYMRVGGGGPGGITYDVSRGAIVHYDGMTADGSKVYFTSDEDLTSDNSDTDSSIDLYMWRESDDSVTRISTGTGTVGDTDNCNAAWIAGCGVEVVPSLEGIETTESDFGPDKVEVAHGGTFRPGGGVAVSNPTDNSIAADAGDVYFYSPEQFVASKGIPGRRNLYVYQAGQIEYVATMDADKAARRFQVTPDGSRAAFITRAKLTTYENAGYEEMYTFTPATGQLVCVSCTPSGAPPTSDVEGSQNGIFMSDDGRTFFATETALLPPDTNGLTDVYEYVEGRPWLISSGVGSIQKSSLGEAGLVGVSADGVDVYFDTYDKLVADDQNGQQLRFYDARAGGGFPQSPTAAPCNAADECHGPPNQTEVLPAIGSSAALGDGGNLSQPTHKARKHHRHHKKRRHRHHGHPARSEHGGRR